MNKFMEEICQVNVYRKVITDFPALQRMNRKSKVCV